MAHQAMDDEDLANDMARRVEEARSIRRLIHALEKSAHSDNPPKLAND